MLIKNFRENAELLLKIIDNYDKTARLLGQENEQWFLDWQDTINEISVR